MGTMSQIVWFDVVSPKEISLPIAVERKLGFISQQKDYLVAEPVVFEFFIVHMNVVRIFSY